MMVITEPRHEKPRELQHDKTNKMTCALSEDSDQTGRIQWSDWASTQSDQSLRWAHRSSAQSDQSLLNAQVILFYARNNKG